MDNLHAFTPDTELPKHVPEIELIRHTLTEVIDDAITDFLMLTTTLKEFTRLASEANLAEASSRLSESVKSIQSMDAFIQKLNHIVKLNEMIAHDEGSVPAQAGTSDCYPGLILKLNHLQVIAASHDFVWIVSNLKQNLNNFQAQIMKVSTVSFSDSDYFKHNDIIETKLDLIASELEDLANKWINGLTTIDEETGNKLKRIQAFYSIESERFVIEWLINNLHGKDTQLMAAYKSRFDFSTDTNIIQNEIELF